MTELPSLWWRLQYCPIAIPETWLQHTARWNEHPQRSARGHLTPALHWISTNSLWLWRKNNNWSMHLRPGEGERGFLEECIDSLRQIKAEAGKRSQLLPNQEKWNTCNPHVTLYFSKYLYLIFSESFLISPDVRHLGLEIAEMLCNWYKTYCWFPSLM